MFTSSVLIQPADCGPAGTIHISHLFNLLQNVSSSDLSENHPSVSASSLFAQNILWIVTQYDLRLQRLPRFNETLLLHTWSAAPRHFLIPRYYRVETADHQCLIQGSSWWSLLDKNTRQVIFPAKAGIAIPGDSITTDIPLPHTLVKQDLPIIDTFTCPSSFCDINGHMNNTRYFDLVEDHLSPDIPDPVRIRCSFAKEIRQHETIQFGYKRTTDEITCSGTNIHTCFDVIYTLPSRA